MGAWWMVDVGSTNGTRLANITVDRHELKAGDRLLFGHRAWHERQYGVQTVRRRRRNRRRWGFRRRGERREAAVRIGGQLGAQRAGGA